MWHHGPTFLHHQEVSVNTNASLASETAEDDPEVRPVVQALETQIMPDKPLGTSRLARFSQRATLVRAIGRGLSFVQSHRQVSVEKPSTTEGKKPMPSACLLNRAKFLIIQNVQREAYEQEISCLYNSDGLPKTSPKLNPKVGYAGLVGVGGRLRRASLSYEESHPLILPSSHHVSSLLIKHFHEKVQHQGRDFTLVSARRTRGGMANNKRWAVLFTCLTTRAIHIEVIESMDASCFINASRRFLALRGPAVQFRADCGTNFVGARNGLQSSLKDIDDRAIQSYLATEGCNWIFNAPHASHAGRVWERMIGVTRRILDSVLADLGPKRLTHEVLTTLMAEVTAIVNARPLLPVPSDPEMPEILTPATLLTQKSRALKSIPGNFSSAELYSKQWRQVQHLANMFRTRWRKEYLPTLQPRRKWQGETRNLEERYLVLFHCKESPRNYWPLARITKAYVSADGKVRKVDLVTAKDGSTKSYTRPVTEVILLRSEKYFEKMRTPLG